MFLYSNIVSFTRRFLTNQMPPHIHANDANTPVHQNTQHTYAQIANCSLAANHSFRLVSVHANHQQCAAANTLINYIDMSDSVSAVSSVPPDFEPESEFTLSETALTEADTLVTAPSLLTKPRAWPTRMNQTSTLNSSTPSLPQSRRKPNQWHLWPPRPTRPSQSTSSVST